MKFFKLLAFSEVNLYVNNSRLIRGVAKYFDGRYLSKLYLEGEVESFRYFLVYRAAFAGLSFKYLGSHTFNKLSEVTRIDIYRLN